MLVVTPLRNTIDERQSEMESFPNGGEDFPDFPGGNLLDCIDFDDLLVEINEEDVLPDLEMDPKIFAEFSLSGSEESEMTSSKSMEKVEEKSRSEEVEKANSASDHASGSTLTQGGEDVDSKANESTSANLSPKEADKRRKTSSKSKNDSGKRKVKVDWTPELHRRFVQAVEQLGVDKAVPSRILELMGIDCLTRHNIASHLQKYRSHRKHMRARETEAANWNQRQQTYGAMAPGGKRCISPWLAPTMGFPPPMAPMPHFRPLHVWGHPSVDQSLMPVWPRQLGSSPSPTTPPQSPASWASAAFPHPSMQPADPSFWHSSHHHEVPNSLTLGRPCFPPHLVPGFIQRFPTPPVPGIPTTVRYKVHPYVPTGPAGQPVPQGLIDFHPSKESIDAAIGDVLSKPWLPLPLGLKPPSVDIVLEELQRQGMPKIPPDCV